ncbi:hypothetical protein [Richelia sinica]|uniref:hypothetical protein n=1 Tax=Richelia sinica TaxID=1357545 RepID=UPI001683599B|nr:hypothetical protein [Richelia sinica]MBD2666589.1 hypothetical protein [Richelia sinica FACHB-800]
MAPITPTSSPNSQLNLILFSIPQSCLIQLGTAAVISLLLAEKATSQALASLGAASEELFRGDRLPILDFPEDNTANHS